MDPDLNKYDLNHRVVHHPKMSDAEWEETYRDAWRTYYTPEHIETVISACNAATGNARRHEAMFMLLWVLRLRDHRGRPSARRRLPAAEVPARPPAGHAARASARPLSEACGGTARKAFVYGKLITRNYLIYRRVINDPNRFAYTDTALTPPTAADFETLELFSNTTGGTTAVEQKHRDDERRARVNALVAHRGG